MNDTLPSFRKTSFGFAESYARRVFGAALVDINVQAGGYFRAFFQQGYFTIQPGKDAPSKSQWNTLKKHMKRLNRNVLVLKQTGHIVQNNEPVYFVDFGFLEN